MTDTSQLFPNAQAVSSDLLYTLKPSSVPGRSYRCSSPSVNKSLFNCGEQIILTIPGGRRNTFLDTSMTYLKFTIFNNDVTNVINVDNNASCVISRIDTYHGSNLLETIQQYNVLFTYLMDFQSNIASKYSASAIYGEAFTTLTSATAGQDYRKGAPINPSTGLTFCIPIISSVWGLCSDKFLPLGLLGDDLRIEITLEGQTAGMVCVGATTGVAWSVSNVELELTIVELGDQGMAMVNNATPINQPIYLHSTGYRHYVSSLPVQGSAGFYSTLVPARFASVKNLIMCSRRAPEIAGLYSYSISSRVNPNISSYFWRVGPYIIPQKSVTLSGNGVRGYAEAYMETLRSFHQINAADIHASIGFEQYNVADTADATVGNGGVRVTNVGQYSNLNAFAIGQELEMFAFRNDILISGLNTLASQVFFECNIGAATGQGYTLDFYAAFDTIYVLENGLMSARY